jgi:hypothetical protein
MEIMERRGRTLERTSRPRRQVPIINKWPVPKKYIMDDVHVKKGEMIAKRDIRSGAVIYKEKCYLSWLPMSCNNMIRSFSYFDRDQMLELFEIACATPFCRDVTCGVNGDVVGKYISSLLESNKITHSGKCYFFPGASKHMRAQEGNCGYNIVDDVLYIITKRCILKGDVCTFTNIEEATTQGIAGCVVCGLPGLGVECQSCNRVFYCGSSCQDKDSKRHQLSCTKYNNVVVSAPIRVAPST